MNVYEIYFNNGGSYEDNYIIRNYYETYKEARAAFDSFTFDDYYDDKRATITINEYELGTQNRTRIYSRLFKNLPSQKAFEEEERRRYE